MSAVSPDNVIVLRFTPPAAFVETAASMRRAFEDLRAAEDALERQLVDIRAQIDACTPQDASRVKAS